MKTYKIFILLISLFLFGCGDFLEPKSKSEFVPKDANSLNELLLGEAYYKNNVDGIGFFLGLLDDDVDGAPYQEYAIDQDRDARMWLAVFGWNSDMYKVIEDNGLRNADIYFKFYELILGANAIMDYSDDIANIDHNLDNVVAQALTLRAYYYLQLVNWFGVPYNEDKEALGVPLKLNSGKEEKPIERHTVAEVYNQIVEDLTEAIRLYELLEPERQWKPNYRTSLPLAQLLLSRTYLYMEEWEKAAAYAEKVMMNSNFKLLDLNSVESTKWYSPEQNSYVEIPTYLDYHNYANNPESIWLYGNIVDYTKWLFNNKVNTNEEQHSFFMASESLMNSFDTTDLRANRYITRSWYEIDGELMPQAFGKMNVGEDTNYFAPKKTINTFARSMRLSEAYLNYCEAQVKLGKTAEATKALNALRKCRFSAKDFVEYTAENTAEMLQFVKDERRRELCFEDHRWFDLRRWGMPEIKHRWYTEEHTVNEYTLQKKDLGYVLPLPTQATEANPNLKQNPKAPARSPKVINVN